MTVAAACNQILRQTLVCLAAAITCLSAFAAAPTPSAFNSRLWQTDDGLPHNSVQAIIQTQDGYLWIGTQDGLARFDGIRFTTFTSQNVPELVGHVITTLWESKDSSLWIGTDSGGLTRFKDGKFSHYGKTNGLTSDSIRAILDGADGSIWIGTSEGLVRFKDERFTPFDSGGVITSVRALCDDGTGGLWIATGSGLNLLKEGKLTNFQRTSGLLHSSVRRICRDHQQALWVGTDGGLTRLDRTNVVHFTKNDGLDANFFSAIFEDHNQGLWVGTPGGLLRFSDGQWIPELTSAGAPFDPVFSIYEDREENMWVGTKSGLYRLTPQRFKCYTTAEGFTHNETVSVIEDRKGGLWIGTRGGGLQHLDRQNVETFTTTNGLSSDFVLALCETADGSLLIGTDFLGGLNRLTGDSFTQLQRRTGMNSAIICICEDRRGTVWIGTRNGLWRLRNGEFTKFGKIDGNNNTVRTLFEDHTGKLWMGSDRGLASWDGDQFTSFVITEGRSTTPVFAIHEDNQGRLWIGMRGGGLSRFDGKQFTNYTNAHGLPNDTVFEILEDDGWLWISSPKGIFRVAKTDFENVDSGKARTLNCISYGKEDGMVTGECVGIAKPAGFKGRDGRMWFTTAKGVVCVDPKMKLNTNIPPITIEQVFSDRKALPVTAEIEIATGRSELELHYSALSFRAPEKNRFRYKLDGVDSDWIEAGTRRVAYYNNLPPGRYEFHVVGCNNDGNWNTRGTTLAIRVHPHLSQTWWFKTGMALSVCGVCYGFYRFRQTRRREIEQLRLRIAADLHDEIGANLASIALLSQMEPKTAEEKSELSEIHRIAVSTTNSIREIVWFINPDYDNLPQMISRMKDVASNLLGTIDHRFIAPDNLSSSTLSLEFRRNIFLVFKEALHNIAKHSQASCVEIEAKLDGGHFSLRISDNGLGFDEKSIRRGNGLKNMRLRLAQLKGELRMESSAGHGTTIRFHAPLT